MDVPDLTPTRILREPLGCCREGWFPRMRRVRLSTVHLARFEGKVLGSRTLCGLIRIGCGGKADTLVVGERLDAYEQMCSRCETIQSMKPQSEIPPSATR